MDTAAMPERLGDLQTPCFVVNIDKVKANCARMQERCDTLGVNLRPHMKTHKTIEAGMLMTKGTKRGVVVSTVKEAEHFADAGFDDILYAYPFTKDKIPRLQKLSARLDKFHVLVDNHHGLDSLVSNDPGTGKQWLVWLKVDCGTERDGVPWDSPELPEIARRITEADSMAFQGIYAHEGPSYNCRGQSEVERAGDETADCMLQVLELLSSVGIECPNAAIGSTPTCSRPGTLLGKLTEFHPGNYVFYDCQQCTVGSCSLSDVAGRVMTRVIGHYPHRNQLLVDCGFLALSHDGKGALPSGSYCYVEGNPNLRLSKLTQEIGFVEPCDEEEKIDFDNYPIDSVLYLFPYHSCATAAMFSEYYVHDNDSNIVEIWRPCRGW